MAIDSINVSDNSIRRTLHVTDGSVRRTVRIDAGNESEAVSVSDDSVARAVDSDNKSPYYVGARAYVTQVEDGAILTVIDKEGTTTAKIFNGIDGTTIKIVRW